MKVAIAQIRPFKGDVTANIKIHQQVIQKAVSRKADAIFFPELSLTGYEPELANDLATTQNDARLESFQQLSDTNKLTIGLGMPTRCPSGVQISMIVFQADQPRQTYSKQQLHADELPYFVPGQEQLIIIIKNNKVALAICYESLQADHAQNASMLGARMYIASVAKSQAGVKKAVTHYPATAAQLAMPILMSNCVGNCDNFIGAGQSSIWNKHGKLLKQFDDTCEGLLILDSETEAVLEERF